MLLLLLLSHMRRRAKTAVKRLRRVGGVGSRDGTGRRLLRVGDVILRLLNMRILVRLLNGRVLRLLLLVLLLTLRQPVRGLPGVLLHLKCVRVLLLLLLLRELLLLHQVTVALRGVAIGHTSTEGLVVVIYQGLHLLGIDRLTSIGCDGLLQRHLLLMLSHVHQGPLLDELDPMGLKRIET